MAKVKKAGKKRLVGLEVDEFSLVDKPAIGESFYVTKSVNEEGEESVTTKKKGVKAKSEAGKGEEAKADETTTKAAEEEEGEEEQEEEESDVVSKKLDELEKKINALDERTKKAEDSAKTVEEMLTKSLALHEQTAAMMNEIVNLNLSALDAVMVMAKEDEDGDMEEGEESTTKTLVQGIRDSIKSVRSEVSKAGAKISRTRMSSLKEIADKLAALIASVEGENAEKGGERKKSVEVMKSIKENLDTFNTSVTKQFSDLTDSCKQLEKNFSDKVDGIAKRLDEIENTAGASDAIDDEGESEESKETSGTTNKSVFANLIPVADIKARVEKRTSYLSGNKDK